MEAGFADIGVAITRRYTVAEAGVDNGALPVEWEDGDGKLASAFVRAAKPHGATEAPHDGDAGQAATHPHGTG